MDGIDVKARAALVRMLRVGLWPEDPIFDRVETHIEKRARVCARP